MRVTIPVGTISHTHAAKLSKVPLLDCFAIPNPAYLSDLVALEFLQAQAHALARFHRLDGQPPPMYALYRNLLRSDWR
jgi:hypothetical protein